MASRLGFRETSSSGRKGISGTTCGMNRSAFTALLISATEEINIKHIVKRNPQYLIVAIRVRIGFVY